MPGTSPSQAATDGPEDPGPWGSCPSERGFSLGSSSLGPGPAGRASSPHFPALAALERHPGWEPGHPGRPRRPVERWPGARLCSTLKSPEQASLETWPCRQVSWLLTRALSPSTNPVVQRAVCGLSGGRLGADEDCASVGWAQWGCSGRGSGKRGPASAPVGRLQLRNCPRQGWEKPPPLPPRSVLQQKPGWFGPSGLQLWTGMARGVGTVLTHLRVLSLPHCPTEEPELPMGEAAAWDPTAVGGPEPRPGARPTQATAC